MRRIKFYKATGQGNDYIVFEDLKNLKVTPHLIRSLCDRHRGIGGDGVILFERGESFFARIFNSDGSEAEISGNGLRCLASVIHFLGWGKDLLRIKTIAGFREITLKEKINDFEYLFEMEIGKAEDIEDIVVFIKEKNVWLNGLFVKLANPHLVVFKNEFNMEELLMFGPLIEKNSLFTEGVNVEFTKVLSDNEIFSHFWERGVGHTLSSGTGAAASAIASIKRYDLSNNLTVFTEGGNYSVKVIDEKIFQTGNATLLYEGMFFLP